MVQENKIMAQSALPPSYTLRLTFAYDENGIRLIHSQRVEMIAPPALTLRPQEGQAGYWVEVRDAKGNLLYYRPLHDPVRADLEVFSDDPAQPIMRIPNPLRSGEFTVLVPDLPDAESFILHGPPTGPRLKVAPSTAPSGELLRYSFDQLRHF